MNRLANFWTKPRIGAALLALAFAVGCTQLFLNNFADEGENLASGVLALRGLILYKDIFSHHFPFAHYWAEFVFRLFGSSILAVRLSVLLFQITSFALVMKLTRCYVSVGLAALVWNLIKHSYFGNMVLYQNFTGIALLVIFAVTFALISGSILASWKEILTLGVFSTIALLANPLVIYPLLITFLFLAGSKVGVKRTIVVILIVGIGLGCYLGYLLVTGTLMDFYRQTITFNSKVLSHYTDTNPVGLLDNVKTALKALNILDPRWINLQIIKPLPSFPYSEVDYQLYTGFLYRLSVILTSLILLAHRQFLSALFVYLFAATLLVRADQGFHHSPFVVMSLLTVSWLITGEWRQYQTTRKNHYIRTINSSTSRNLFNSLVKQAEKLAKLIVFALLIVLMLKGTESLAGNWKQLSYQANFAAYEQRAEQIKRLACGRSDVALAYYPGEPIIYFFTEMPTVSKYFYMYPWIAEIGLSNVINSLKTNTAVVFFDQPGQVWGYKNKEYLSSLKNYLNRSYVPVDDFYLSPSLVRECLSNSPQINASPASVTPLKVKSIAEINFKTASVAETTIGYLDTINDSTAPTIEVMKTTPITARGWAVIANKGKPADSVIITQGDKNSLIAVVPVNLERQDIAKALNNPAYTNSGWSAIINPSTLPNNKVVLKAWAYNAAQKQATQLNYRHEVVVLE